MQYKQMNRGRPWRLVLLVLILLITGCSHPIPAPRSSLANSKWVAAQLNRQLHQWYQVPYQFGGLSRRGIDCSGFVQMTFRQRFAINLPRTTTMMSKLGTEISEQYLQPGDLIFFKTGWGFSESSLHVGIYSGQRQFIHASTRRGVTRSSLNNRYWRETYWQSRRL